MCVRQHSLLNCHFRTAVAAVLGVIAVVFVGAGDCVARQGQGVTSPARGFQPAGSYALSDIETISTKNGNLMLHIPLVTLPAGRGGSGAGIGLYYNSKLYEAYSTSAFDHDGNNTIVQALRQSPEGGWRYGLRYSLTLYNLNEYRLQGFTCNSDPGINYIYKLQVNFPDGSSHVLHRGGQAEYGGYSRNRPDGWIYDCLTNNNSPAVTGPMVYYSTDGSYLRLVVEHDSDGTWENNPWKLYLPDGTRVEGGGGTTTPQRIYDRNENYVEVRDSSYNGHPAKEVADEFGRLLRIEEDADNGKDYIYQRGPNNNEIKWTVEWSGVFVNKSCYGVDNPQGFIQEETGVAEFIRFVSKITLPAEAGSLTYEFKYNAEESTGLNGWGELSFIKLPTGARASYSYNMDGVDATTSAATYRDVLENYPAEKRLIYDNVYDGNTSQATELWKYRAIHGSFNANSTFEIESPTGGITREKFSESGWLPRQYDGQPYRTENPDGTVVERVFGSNVPFGLFPSLTQAGDEPWSTNAFVTKEFHSVRNAAGDLSKTALTEYKYDKNGNVTEVKEYDWVDYIRLSHDSNGRPVGLTVSAPLKRVTTSSYYNPTPNSSDTSDAVNSYHKSSAPRLLHLLESGEIGDGVATLSRTESFYDSLARGNLSEQRSWDSTKGLLTRPLAPGRYVSVSKEYDSHGNLTYATDANGVQTQFVYEPINGVADLYPTKIIKAVGKPVALTTLQEYEFQSGLVTRTTDFDNNVATVTAYDNLGRPTLVRAAADKLEETQAVTVYADAEGRVVTRADLDGIGDGKLVAITHYDQLGRIRLSRTLEVASALDEADETKGIKVQTRYLIDPATHLSHQMVSNPYRAPKATEAVNESTMGWSLTTSDQGGRVIKVESFEGAALPAPFETGANANIKLTGAVLTSYDAEAVIIADQAERQRRSVSDGLGRTAQVFEAPNAAGYNYLTSYSYDAHNNLTQVVQDVQTRTFTYSSLSRLTAVQTPEGGTVQYQYDANGNPILRIDPRPRPGSGTLPTTCPISYGATGSPPAPSTTSWAASRPNPTTTTRPT